MARKKKQDFWDDVDEDVIESEQESEDDDKYKPKRQKIEEDDGEEDGFRATRSVPLKVVARIFLFIAAAVVAVSGFICYKYVDDRYVDGSFKSSYFESKSFSVEYNDRVLQLVKLVQALESDPGVLENTEGLEALKENYLGTDTNFSYLVYDDAEVPQIILSSGEDALDRFETSNHKLKISTKNDNFIVETLIPTKGLDKLSWETVLDECESAYGIYTAVNNNLEPEGEFYESYLEYDNLTKYFGLARITGIAGLVVFLVLFIFCIIATGQQAGTSRIKLSWFDKIVTEVALLIIVAICGALIYGIWFVGSKEIKFADYIQYGLAALIYLFLIRGYFSLVRRIKAGTFTRNSVIYMIGSRINNGLNKLPKPVKAVIIILFLLLLNGGLVLGLLYLRDITVKNIPVIFVVAPIIFVIELIVFISCIFGVSDEDEEYDDEEDEETDFEGDEEPFVPVPAGLIPDHIPGVDANDWENIDFSQTVQSIQESGIIPESQEAGLTMENVMPPVEKTVMLTPEETNKVRESIGLDALDFSATTPDVQAALARESGLEPKLDSVPEPKLEQILRPEPKSETKSDLAGLAEPIPSPVVPPASVPVEGMEDGKIDFIQLNKDVRKLFRMKLKAKSIGVTLRAPEKPIYVNIEKEDAIKVLSILFDNIEMYAKESSRVYIEIYAQKGKMMYMMKNTIKDEDIGSLTTELGRGLTDAKRLIQSLGGKLVNTIDGSTYKVGVLLDIVED